LLVPESVKEGEQATFFTQGWLLGSGVAVRELKHLTPPLGDDQVKAMLAEGSKVLDDRALSSQLATASCVITGQVETVSPLKSASHKPSEHDPKWQDAKIKVLTIEKKGCLSAKAQTIDVVFPSSKDIAWVNAPRFQEGQQGIWILNPIPGGKFKAFAAPSPNTYTSLNAEDFKNLDKIAAVRSILRMNEVK
jgi:cytochrome c551/c552